MTKFNLLMRAENEGILESIIDSAHGKLIIASDNSFAISSILEELKGAAWAGGFELYNGSVKVNPEVNSDTVIVAVCTQMSYSMPKITPEFKVATFTRESKESFVFDIEISSIKNSDEFGYMVDGMSIPVPTPAIKPDDETEIFNSLRAHNVVFVQDLNDGVIQGVENKRDDVKKINSVTTISEGYVVTTDDGVIVPRFDAPSNFTVEHSDCMAFISNALKYGVTIMCNTTWVRFFLELTSTEDDINLSSVVIYNNSVFGPMGNAELYTAAND